MPTTWLTKCTRSYKINCEYAWLYCYFIDTDTQTFDICVVLQNISYLMWCKMNTSLLLITQMDIFQISPTKQVSWTCCPFDVLDEALWKHRCPSSGEPKCCFLYPEKKDLLLLGLRQSFKKQSHGSCALFFHLRFTQVGPEAYHGKTDEQCGEKIKIELKTILISHSSPKELNSKPNRLKC